ncbi:hypothetical protein EDC48_107219 [Gibbsiella quercinecans]|nr:hypothetical protein EDC48_107219 [Gibbsiella quercinecans]
MTDEHGNLVWQGQFSAWSEARSKSPRKIYVSRGHTLTGKSDCIISCSETK